MFKTLVIGIDDRADNHEALTLARRLADPGARLVAAQITPIDANPGAETTLYFDAEAVRETERSARRFGRAHEDLEVITETAPSPGEGLRAVAQRLGADVIVVGSSLRGLLGRVFAGDDVLGTIRHAPCAVAVAPLGYTEPQGPLGRIVVGHDGTAAADAALKRAAELRLRDDCEVEVIDVVERAVSVVAGVHGTYAGVAAPDELESARVNVSLLEQRTGVAGEILSGDAADVLSHAARTSDLLAIGLQHRGRLDRLLHGSAAHALLREQTTPLLIVPALDGPGPRATAS
ncbi:MAG: universal stress protein [Solirubrobacteraceae bacterium]|nr:universal stress protein [Solirubrobacteraceae bacterium]